MASIRLSLQVPSFDTAKVFLGFTIATAEFSMLGFAASMNLSPILKQMQQKMMENVPRSVYLINSFFGLEQADLLPPWAFLTGPLTPPIVNFQSKLSETHPEMAAFIGASEKVAARMGGMGQGFSCHHCNLREYPACCRGRLHPHLHPHLHPLLSA